VKCKHGATTGQLDQDALFYLRSRGIPHTEAMNILLQGFAEEVIDRITHPGIRIRVQEVL
jgi:Fe-S cluster assembly protein SufD